jgi:hypothetical protein
VDSCKLNSLPLRCVWTSHSMWELLGTYFHFRSLFGVVSENYYFFCLFLLLSHINKFFGEQGHHQLVVE